MNRLENDNYSVKSVYKKYQGARISHWDKVAEKINILNLSAYYHKRL
jgi:hypothetical protein